MRGPCDAGVTQQSQGRALQGVRFSSVSDPPRRMPSGETASLDTVAGRAPEVANLQRLSCWYQPSAFRSFPHKAHIRAPRPIIGRAITTAPSAIHSDAPITRFRAAGGSEATRGSRRQRKHVKRRSPRSGSASQRRRRPTPGSAAELEQVSTAGIDPQESRSLQRFTRGGIANPAHPRGFILRRVDPRTTSCASGAGSGRSAIASGQGDPRTAPLPNPAGRSVVGMVFRAQGESLDLGARPGPTSGSPSPSSWSPSSSA